MKSVQQQTRTTLLERVFLGVVLLALVVACCSQTVTARDVRVAVMELPPSLYTDEQGNTVGLFADILEDIAGKEGWNLIWVRGSISDSWYRLGSGEVDLMAGVAATPERERVYDFSNESAFSVWSQVYARPDSGINTILDLDRRVIATVGGDSSATAIREYAVKFGINATYLEKDTPATAFAAVRAGEADAVVAFNMAGQDDIKKSGIRDTPVMFNPALFGFAAKKGANKDLLLIIDQYLAKEKGNPSSVFSQSMQKWFGIKAGGIIPTWVWWGLGVIALFAGLFVIMNLILRREVRRKTAELARQNEELLSEVACRTQAEHELVRKNEELHAAYEELTAKDQELQSNFMELMMSEKALMQARKKLTLLNMLTFQDIKNAFFILSGYIQLSKDAESIGEAETHLHAGEQILQSVKTTLAVAEKYQNLGINQARWQNVVYVFISAISHIDFSRISRTVEIHDLEIYADPLLEDVFLALMEFVLLQGPGVTRMTLRCRRNADSITILVQTDGPGIPLSDKEDIFTWEQTGKGGCSLFLAREILSITEISLKETGEEGNGICFEITVPQGEYRIAGTHE